MRGLVKVYKVLADESRLRALNLVLEKECCVCEVMQALQISQSKASRLLSALYDAGFLKLRKDGLWSLYSIDEDGMSAHLKAILEATRKAFESDKQMQIDLERLRKAERVGPGCVGKVCKTPLSVEVASGSEHDYSVALFREYRQQFEKSKRLEMGK